MFPNKRNKIISLHQQSNDVSLNLEETPHFLNTRRRVLTQMDEEHPKFILPKIQLQSKLINNQIQKNDKKLKLTGVIGAFFLPNKGNKLPTIRESKKKNWSTIEIKDIPIHYNKVSCHTIENS